MTKEERLSKTLSSCEALGFIEDFLTSNPEAGLFLVGGAVRDILLGHRVRESDFDFVVTRLEPAMLETWFKQKGELNLVGQRFGVYKFMPRGFTARDIAFIDLALPRTETMIDGSLGGYKDFDVQSDPNLPIEDDLARRDFTINAIAYDIRNKALIDPFNGQEDLEQKTVRAVGVAGERFKEDLSRILRGIRFAGELNFKIEEETAKAMTRLIDLIHTRRDLNGTPRWVVPRETIGLELAKVLSRNPARALTLMESLDLPQTLFPDSTLDIESAKRAAPGEITITLSLLLHRTPINQVIKLLKFTGLDTLERESPQHAESKMLLWLITQLRQNRSVKDITRMPGSAFERTFMNKKGGLLIKCLELLDRDELANAANERRTQIENRWLIDRDESIAPLISGQDVLAQGLDPGSQVRRLLDRARSLQLDGTLMRREDALAWLKNEIK